MQALAQWCGEQLIAQGRLSAPGRLQPLSGDASFRRYFRYTAADGRSWVAVHAPPDKEKNREFIAVRALLEQAGVPVPALLAYDAPTGFLLLSDLGDRLLLPALSPERVDGYYRQALAQIVQMQSADARRLPPYDAARLHEEMALCPSWFFDRLLGLALNADEQRQCHALFERLTEAALNQPQVFVHRDYHARNIMLLADERLATIDFQDALRGPLLYDPVSLLKDCYVRWPRARVLDWLQGYLARAGAAGLLTTDTDWVRAFDCMGLQRHIKVLGIFARLHLRDGKPGYLGDLSRVLGYVQEALALYPEFADVADWFEARVLPAARRQAWFRADALVAPA